MFETVCLVVYLYLYTEVTMRQYYGGSCSRNRITSLRSPMGHGEVSMFYDTREQ